MMVCQTICWDISNDGAKIVIFHSFLQAMLKENCEKSEI